MKKQLTRSITTANGTCVYCNLTPKRVTLLRHFLIVCAILIFTTCQTDRAFGQVRPILAGTTYQIVNQFSKKVVDVGQASTSAAALVIQYDYHSGKNQQWTAYYMGSNHWQLVCVNSGFCLTGTDAGAVIQTRYSAKNTQQWIFQPAGDGSFYLVNRASELVLDIGGGPTAAIANLRQTANRHSSSQHWSFAPLVGQTEVAKSTFKIVNQGNEKVAEVSQESTATGASVILASYESLKGQQWTPYSQGSDYFVIVNLNSGQCLASKGDATTKDTSVIQVDYSDKPTLLWKFEPVGEGSFYIINRATGLVLDFDGAAPSEKPLLKQSQNAGSASQHWSLKPIEQLASN